MREERHVFSVSRDGGLPATRRLEPLACQLPGGAEGGDRALARRHEDAVQVALDPQRERAGLLLRVAADLLVDVDQAARVRDEVGGVENVALGERLGQRIVRELIVGGPADDVAAQKLSVLSIDRAAERARRKDVALRENRLRGI